MLAPHHGSTKLRKRERERELHEGLDHHTCQIVYVLMLCKGRLALNPARLWQLSVRWVTVDSTPCSHSGRLQFECDELEIMLMDSPLQNFIFLRGIILTRAIPNKRL